MDVQGIIRPAQFDDIPLLCEMGKRAYRQHFSYLWTPDGLEHYLTRAYHPNVFQDALADDNAIIWLVQNQQELCGFLMYYRRKRLPGLAGSGGYINRIYLLESCAGRGLGSRLMGLALEQVRNDGCSYLWLEAMQSSTDTIRFYQKHGFKIHGATAYTQLPMRNTELAKMWWMTRQVIP